MLLMRAEVHKRGQQPERTERQKTEYPLCTLLDEGKGIRSDLGIHNRASDPHLRGKVYETEIFGPGME